MGAAERRRQKQAATASSSSGGHARARWLEISIYPARLHSKKRKSLSLSLNGMSCVKEATAFRKIRASCGRAAARVRQIQGREESCRFRNERTG